MFKRIFTAIFLTILSVILLVSVSLAYLIISPAGGKLLVKYFRQQFASIGLMSVGHYEGSLQGGFILSNVMVRGIDRLPGAVLAIQEIRVHLPLWDLPHSDAEIFNARLNIPNSDPLVFTGDVSAGNIKGNLYGQSLDLQQLSRFYPDKDISRNLQGYLTDIDLMIQGALSSSAHITGTFQEDHIQYKSVLLTNATSKIDLILFHILKGPLLKGNIMVGSGVVNVRHTNLQLSESDLILNGNIQQPFLDIHLGANVEDMTIHMTIRGVVSSPQLNVTSDPPMPPQEALQVLFTGNAFSSSTSPFNGVSSGELAQDFLNYSLVDIDDQSQFGLKTKVSNNLKLGAEMDELPGPPGATNVYYSRKINGEMDLTDHMSLNVSREVFSPDDRNPYVSGQDQDAEDTQIYMQYKKRF